MYMMRLYRATPGDIAKGDVPCTETDLEQAEVELRDYLASAHAAGTVPRTKPLWGQLVDDDDKVVATFSMRPNGAVKVPNDAHRT